MEDFDLMYMLKTPLFMGTPEKVVTEADTVELNADDVASQTLKNLLVARALTLQGNFDQLKAMFQALLQDSCQAASVQPLSMFVQYCAQNVSLNFLS